MNPKIVVTTEGQPSRNKKKTLFLILPVVVLCIGLYKQRGAKIQETADLIIPTASKFHVCFIFKKEMPCDLLILIQDMQKLKCKSTNNKIKVSDFWAKEIPSSTIRKRKARNKSNKNTCILQRPLQRKE